MLIVRYVLIIFLTCLTFFAPKAEAVNKGQNSTSRSKTLSQFGITWTFKKAYETGQFANGDYWVVGPVEIIHIDPQATSNPTLHGSMINPVVSSDQGYDSRLRATRFVAGLNVAAEFQKRLP